MAFDWSKLNFFSRLDARARIFVLFFAVIGTILVIYFLVRVFFGGGPVTGGSAVATVPQGMASVPGGTVTPEYARAMEQQRNLQEKQALMTGTTAVPTLVRTGQPTEAANCTIICAEQKPSVNDLLDDWVSKGLDPAIAQALEASAAKNVPVDEYAAEVSRLVRDGKLTPEQARQLLERYRKQHDNALLQESAAAMDEMIKSGELPVDVANHLLEMQRNGASPAEYAAELDRLVREGKISPATAAKLLAQYTQQCVTQSMKQNNLFVQQMMDRGEITAQVASELTALSNNNSPVSAYSNSLKKNVSAGAMTPNAATKLVEAYTRFKSACAGSIALMKQMIEKAEAAAYKEIADLLAANKIGKDVATSLTLLIKSNVPFPEFEQAINNFVTQRKLTPEIAKLKLDDYRRVKSLRDTAQRLANLQANNASPAEYANELKRAVQEGVLTPEEAAKLLQEYQAAIMRAPGAPALGPGEAQRQLAALQAGLQQTTAENVQAGAGQFAQAQAQAATESAQDRQARIQALMSAMSNQAGQLVNAWQPPVMQSRQGAPETKGTLPGETTTSTTTTTTTGTTGTTGEGGLGAPVLIKGGTIIFAVLDTAINSDYPDTPIMATVVEGQFKGARLLGKIVTTKGITGQMDRVSLNFTIMNMDAWPKSKSITAYAIDPDTARTVLASSVNYHYLQRFGAMFATSFLQGYATAIMTSGSTQTTGIFGTSSVHPNLSPSQKIAVGLGQFGQTLGQATANYINRPPTVRVDSGVGLGVLFMSDITS